MSLKNAYENYLRAQEKNPGEALAHRVEMRVALDVLLRAVADQLAEPVPPSLRSVAPRQES